MYIVSKKLAFFVACVRRYCRPDFMRLAQQSGLELCYAHYFMFFLSPLYLLTRMKLGLATLTPAQKKRINF
jgi:hypothetical protein